MQFYAIFTVIRNAKIIAHLSLIFKQLEKLVLIPQSNHKQASTISVRAMVERIRQTTHDREVPGSIPERVKNFVPYA